MTEISRKIRMKKIKEASDMSKILLADDEKGLVTMMKHYFELSAD